MFSKIILIAMICWAAPSWAQEWEKVTEKSGITVERRPVANSAYYEIRVSAHSALSPAALFDTIWKQHEYLQFVPHLKAQRFLKESDDERWIYEQISMPVVADRDYTVHVKKLVDPQTGIYQMVFKGDNAAGPPPAKGFVRVERVSGAWSLEPSSAGGTDVTYLLHSEPGGTLPTWIVNTAQKDSAPDFVRAMLARADATHR